MSDLILLTDGLPFEVRLFERIKNQLLKLDSQKVMTIKRTITKTFVENVTDSLVLLWPWLFISNSFNEEIKTSITHFKIESSFANFSDKVDQSAFWSLKLKIIFNFQYVKRTWNWLPTMVDCVKTFWNCSDFFPFEI